MSPIRVYFPTSTTNEPWAFQKRGEVASIHFNHDPQWESLIENASEIYAKANDQCKLYIAKGIIQDMQTKNPSGQFYQFQQDYLWHCLSPKEVLHVTQAALINTQANRKGKPKVQEKQEVFPAASKYALKTKVAKKKTASEASIEKLRNKFVSILRVLANSSLSQADHDFQIKGIAEDAIEYVNAVEGDLRDVDMADCDSDGDSTAPPRRKKRLLTEDYYLSGNGSVCETEMASGGTVATKLLDNGLMASAKQFEPNSAMAACKIVRNMKIKGDRWYTGSILYQKPHGIGFMKYKDGRITCGNWLNGFSHGQVVVVYKNGDAYIGGYLKNKRNGVGLYRYNDGSKYDGVFERDNRHGRGVYTTCEGDAYDGTFVQGRFEGQGVHRYLDGSEERGRFENWVHTEQ